MWSGWAGSRTTASKSTTPSKAPPLANEMIDGLPRGLAFLCEVTREYGVGVGRQGRSQNTQASTMRPVDDLPHPYDDVFGAHLLVWQIGAAGMSDIVDRFHQDHRADARHCQHVPVESCDGGRPELSFWHVVQDAIAADPRIDHGERGAGLREAFGEDVRPPSVSIDRRAIAVGDRVTQGHDGRAARGFDIDAAEEEPRRARCRLRQGRRRRRVAAVGEKGGGTTERMCRGRSGVSRDEEADGHTIESLDVQRPRGRSPPARPAGW